MENNKKNRKLTSKKSATANINDTSVDNRLSENESNNRNLNKKSEQIESSRIKISNMEMPMDGKKKPLSDPIKRGYVEEQLGTRKDDKDRIKNDSKRKGLEKRESEIKGGKDKGENNVVKDKSDREQESKNKKYSANTNDKKSENNPDESDNAQQFESEYPRKKYGSVQRKNIK